MNTASSSKLAVTLRWIARLWSLGSVGIVVAFVVGAGFNPASLKLQEALLFACFPLAVLAGLMLGWKWPVGGGTLAILGVLGFYALHLAFAGQFPGGFAFILIALPGWLFILSALLAPGTTTTTQSPQT